MKTERRKIKTAGIITFVVLLGIAALFILFGLSEVYSIVQYLSAPERYRNIIVGFGDPKFFALSVMQTIASLCTAGVLVFIAFIFWTIQKKETPFLKSVSARMKVSAVLLFCVLAAPHLIAYISDVLSSGVVTLSFIDSSTILAVTLAVALYCFGLIFDYGSAIQDENDEIL